MRMALTGLAAGLTLWIAGCGQMSPDGVAAVVDGYKITHGELEVHYRNHVRDFSASPSEEEGRRIRLTLLREMIDRQIMLRRAEKLGLAAVDAEVDSRLEEYRAPYPSADAFQEFLGEQGMNVNEFKAELRRTLTVEKLFNKEITSKLSIDESEVRTYYERNQASFNQPEEQLHLAWIVVTAAPETPVPNLRNDDAVNAEEAEKKIKMIERRLKDGELFDEVAQNFSEDPDSTGNGGDLGFIPRSALENADLDLRRVVASLSPGEVSPIVKFENGFRIVRLISREPAGQRELSDPRVQQTIRRTLRNRKDQLLKAAYLEVARNEARVENVFAARVLDDWGVSGY